MTPQTAAELSSHPSRRGLQIVRASTVSTAVIALALTMTMTARGEAADTSIVPNTKLRVTVVQWMPMKGTYEPWTALSGEFGVDADATLTLPVIGAVSVAGLDTSGLAARISSSLQERLGTVERPETTVQIAEYPPIYLMGDVETPGAYPYRVGLTALQAMALGGGERRAGEEQSRDQIRLVGEIQGLETEIFRATARAARLRAEAEGASAIRFPVAPPDQQGVADEVVAQEKAIFDARANELDRQARSLNELRDLLNAEIDVLQTKIVAADQGIATLEKELRSVTSLVDKGIAIASRQSELERALSGYRSDRLDQVTAVMRARQGLAQATRDLDGLQDRRRTDVASDLQREQSGLEQLMLKRDISQRILVDMLAKAGARPSQEPVFQLIRQQDGQPVEVAAGSATALQPGDVVKVSFSSVAAPSDQSASAATVTGAVR